LKVTTQVSGCGDNSLANARSSIHDNVFDDIDGWKFNLTSGACFCSWSTGIVIGNSNATQDKATNSVAVNHNTILGSFSGVGETAGTEGAVLVINTCGSNCSTTNIQSVTILNNLGGGGFNDNASKTSDYCVASGQQTPSTSLLNCAVGTSSTTGWFVSNNASSPGTVPGYPVPASNTPWPATSPAAPPGTTVVNWPITSGVPQDYTQIGFTNLNNANGGDYTLLGTSPFHYAATDLSDVGANIGAVNSATGRAN
jgi:hypothetical protein